MTVKGRNPVQLSIEHQTKMRAAIRHRRSGTAHPFAKLSPEKVAFIRQQRALGRSQQSIADELGVSQTAISRVLLGATWRTA